MKLSAIRKRPAVQFFIELLLCLIGRAMFAISVNIFINPLHLYSVGFTGIAQLIRTFCINVLGIVTPPGVDLTGIIFAIINIPVLILAYFGVGKKFFLKTFTITLMSSFLMTIVPVPAAPILDDKLTLCILGGLIGGLGAGIAITVGGSGGGQDVLGVYFSKKNPNMSVGIFSLCLSCAIYLTCIIAFDFETLAYSFIYSTIISLSLDKFTYQNIKIRVEIETTRADLQAKIAETLHRDVLCTVNRRQDGQEVYILKLTITKKEEKSLKSLLNLTKQDNFAIMVENVSAFGSFNKEFA